MEQRGKPFWHLGRALERIEAGERTPWGLESDYYHFGVDLWTDPRQLFWHIGPIFVYFCVYACFFFLFFMISWFESVRIELEKTLECGEANLSQMLGFVDFEVTIHNLMFSGSLGTNCHDFWCLGNRLEIKELLLVTLGGAG